jgi:hypothetical protein
LLLDKTCLNVHSTGDGNYGKTPIFYAITRNRNEVVNYLLNIGANVNIINNKGQSPRSLAISHLTSDTIKNIEIAEINQINNIWLNYRETNSDGLEYGDGDPRKIKNNEFYNNNAYDLNKDNRDNEDNNNGYSSIKPTTAESRRFRMKDCDRHKRLVIATNETSDIVCNAILSNLNRFFISPFLSFT